MRTTKYIRQRRAAFAPRLTLCLLVLLSSLPAPPYARAQESQQHVRQRRVAAQAEEVGPGDIVRTDTDLIPVEVTVRDAQGRAVRGLRSGDFRLFEDEVERPISFFSAESAGGASCPLDLVIALDVSGSMTRHEMDLLRDAAAHLRERLSEQDARFAVISFGMRVKVLQSFTDDRGKLEKAFDSITQDQMGLSTHAYDAVDDAVRMLVRQGRKTLRGQVVKRAVIIITDGFPIGDTISPELVTERANAANVSVYSVTMPSFSSTYTAAYGRPLPTIFDLSGLVEKTGGVNVYPVRNNYMKAFKSLSEEVLSKYVLAFYPNREKRRDGGFHNLRVKAPDGLTISQSRPGYEGKGQGKGRR